ncbi:MAG: hypothetical protein LBV54_00865 [Puniceicoccales bacterium]|jgi:tRNA threonylcarbamoyladenosine biosynthesis protein TsaB|nr:hypothetical protein [Puniceicoccales bacterium]
MEIQAAQNPGPTLRASSEICGKPASDTVCLADSTEMFLFLDAAGREPFVGVWAHGIWLACRYAEKQAATESLFTLIDDALRGPWGLSMKLADCGGFIFTEGPGSILGIRIVAMALRGWRALPGLAHKPIYAVGSLELSAHLLLRAKPERRDFTLLADSRQGWWNTAVVRDGVVAHGFNEVRGTELSMLPGPFFRITQRALGAPPVACEPLPEDLLERDPTVLAMPNLLRETDAPDAVNMPGQFVKWEPARHR